MFLCVLCCLKYCPDSHCSYLLGTYLLYSITALICQLLSSLWMNTILARTGRGLIMLLELVSLEFMVPYRPVSDTGYLRSTSY
jgi:hypothetical protein